MSVTDVPSIGTWIREERKKRRLSQFKMARFLEVTHSQLSAWELGKEMPPDNSVVSIREFLSKFDVELAEGRINLSKRRPARYYALSSESSLSSRKQSRKNGSNGERAVDTKIHKTQNANCLYYLSKNGQNLTPDFIWSKVSYKGKDKQPKGIALFAGIGGMSLGFKNAGFNIIGHAELSDNARSIYEANFPDSLCLSHDVRAITDEDVNQWRQAFGQVAVLFGGPPCQGFSLAGKRDHHDPRNQLYNDFVRIASVMQPYTIVMENVRLLTSMKAPDGSYMPENVNRNSRPVRSRKKR